MNERGYEMNLAEPILNRATRYPDRIAIRHGSGQLTYSQLTERVGRIAAGLRQHCAPQDMIAILSANRVEFAEVFLGAVQAGCVPVLLDTGWTTNQLEGVIASCKPKVIFGEGARLEEFRTRHDGILCLTFEDKEQTGTYEPWLASHPPTSCVDASNELLFVGFTSGTTGVPKGYMRTHLSWLRSFDATEEAFRLESMEHVLAPGPFVHSLSLFALVQSLYSGATFYVMERFVAQNVMELCSDVRGMVLFVVPAMIDALLQHASAVEHSGSIQALISSGGQWLERSKERCREVFAGTALYEYYGSSEASYISYMDVLREMRPGSLGRPFKGVEISIRNDRFLEVPAGTAGELFLRSPMMFKAYHQLPEETAGAFREGWLRTGDYMYVDQDGYLYLAGRVQNMIKTGGLKVFPEEVEAVLQRIPSIREVMVFGKPDERWGERVTAMIQWHAEVPEWSLDEIKQVCKQYGLAAYKIPKALVTVRRFAYTSSGKIARQLMKEQACSNKG
ncbi:putative acyl--CoA ligase YhfT [Paenibacillus sp. JJ-223]|nr:putative acyl--CoA ligase YhfT [Paenibacillus sp. JJ-223]